MFRVPKEMDLNYLGTALAVNEQVLTIQNSSIASGHEQTDAGFWADLGPWWCAAAGPRRTRWT